jgi:hypothetical protein
MFCFYLSLSLEAVKILKLLQFSALEVVAGGKLEPIETPAWRRVFII